MTVLVTGANSDIGVEICRQFLDKGNKIVAIVNPEIGLLDDPTMPAM